MRRLIVITLLLLFAAQSALAQLAYDQGAFILTLGQDTIGVEKYTRIPGRVFGESLVTEGSVRHRYFDVHFLENGIIQRMEQLFYEIDAAGNEVLSSHETIIYDVDSTHFTNVVNTSSPPNPSLASSYSVPGGNHLILMQIPIFSVFESLSIWMLSNERDKEEVRLPWGTTQQPVMLEIIRPNLLTIDNPSTMGVVRAHLDAQGRLSTLEGTGTARMSYIARRIPLSIVDSLVSKLRVSNKLLKGVHSPRSQAETIIGGTHVRVDYGRPSIRGRKIFGSLVSWDRVWRTGANGSTLFEVNQNIVVGGQKIPAGRYTLWSIPSMSGWTLIVNKQTGQWGTDYDESEDFVRLPMNIKSLAESVEQFTISIDLQDGARILKMAWENTEAWVSIDEN